MSEIDEGLDEIRDKHTHRVFLRTYNKEHWFVDKATWKDMKQAILDLICQHRGCEPKIIPLHERTFAHDDTGYGPCIYCGKGEGS